MEDLEEVAGMLESETVELSKQNEEDNIVEANESDTKKGKNKPRKRRLSSKVWAHFEFLPIGKDKRQRCRCKKCKKIYFADSKYGTGNFSRHIVNCKKTDTRDVGNMLLSSEKGTLALKSTFDPEKFRELVVGALVLHDLPFNFVEYTGIRAIFLYLESSIQLVSRNTAKADMLKLYKREKERVRTMLMDCPGRISLTSDLWTSITTDGYMCLTAHFIDKNWNLHKRVLNFSCMPSPHNGVTLSDKIYKLLCEWGIEKKVFSLTLDNASSNDVSVELLKTQLNAKQALVCSGDFLHLRCCAHILNLIVQDGLKEIDGAVLKVRESVKYVKASQGRKQKFLESVSQMSLDHRKGLRQDVPTRWNSTFVMLECALYFRRAFAHLELIDSNYKHCPTNEDWEKVEKVKAVLAVFYDCTNAFSGTKYPTSNLYFPAIFVVYQKLLKQKQSSDGYLKAMAERMFSKFEKYWKEFNLTLAVAVVLDPRFKLRFVNFSYSVIYGRNESVEFMRVRDKVFSLFDEYSRPLAPTSEKRMGNENTPPPRESIFNSKETNEVMEEFDAFDSDELSANAQKSQLELYLSEPRLDRNLNMKLDVLAFWKANELRYPELAMMARDILSIPISTVASEATFSVGGRVLDQFRSSLKPEVVEALVCSRDWLYGEQAATESKIDDLTDDILKMDINKEAVESVGDASFEVGSGSMTTGL